MYMYGDFLNNYLTIIIFFGDKIKLITIKAQLSPNAINRNNIIGK